jgi:hypothetical protein
MKLKLFITSLSLAFTTITHGQIGYPQAYGSFNAGLSLPIGSFGSTASADWTGYAKAGTVYSILVGIPIAHSNFGIAIMTGYSKNNYDAATFGTNLAKKDTGNSYSAVTAIAYAQYYLMTGLLVTSNNLNGLSIDGRLLIGFDYVNYPDPYWSTMSIHTGYTTQWYLNTNPTTTLAIALGVGVRYALLNGFTALLNVNYIYTGATCSTQQLVDNSISQTPETLTDKVSNSTLAITLGLGYSLGN